MRKLGIVALGAAAALTLAGCATSGGDAASEDGAEIRVWLVGTDTPDEAREYTEDTFEEDHPGSTLVIEEQSWDGLVDRLTTSLSVRQPRHRRGRQHPGVGVHLGGRVPRPDRALRRARRRRPAARLRRGGLVRREVLRRSAVLGRAPVFYKKDALAAAALKRRPRSTSTSTRASSSPRPTPASRASGGPARTGTTPSLHLGERRRGRGSRRRRVGRAALQRRVRSPVSSRSSRS